MSNTIDIDGLSVEELEALNHQVVERLKFLDTQEAHSAMMQFHPGARVCFDSSKHGFQKGTLMKFNQKTVTIVTDKGRHWNVPPQLLRSVATQQAQEEISQSSATPMNIIDIRKKKFEPV